MKLHPIILCAALASASPAAMAAPATQQEAERLAGIFRPLVGEAADILTVTANGEQYDVKLDLAKQLKRAEPESQFSVTPLIIKLQDQGGGKWLATQAAPLVFSGKELKGEAETQVEAKISGFAVTLNFDQTLGAFVAAGGDMSGVSATVRESGVSGPQTNVSFDMKNLEFDMKSGLAQPLAALADARFHIAFSGITGNADLPPDETIPEGLKLSFALDKASRTFDLKGMRTRPVMKLITLAKSMQGKADENAARIEVSRLLKESLPLFDGASFNGTMYGFSVKTPFGNGGLESLVSDLSVNGIVTQGRARQVITLSGLTLPAGLPQEILPKLALELMPKSMSLDIAVTDYDLAAPAAMLLDHLEKTADEPSPELEKLLLGALLPKGEVTITLAPGSYVSPALTVGYEGSMVAGPEKMPFGQTIVSAKGLDQVIELIKAAPQELELQNGIYGILAAKGFGKQEADGTVTWKIETTREGAVSVNGVKMPGTGAGAD